MITEQKLIVKISDDGNGSNNISLEFEPDLISDKSESYRDLVSDERRLQNIAAHIATHVLEILTENK